MNYNRIYNQLIEKAKLENNLDNVYYERHHIIPKSLGGPNTKSNLVKLVPRQHYIAHLLLYKIYKDKCVDGVDKTPYYKMLRALSAMVQFPAAYNGQGEVLRLFKFGSKNYDTWKRELTIKKKKKSKERIQNLSEEDKKQISKKISGALKEKWKTQKFPWIGKKHSEETLKKMKEYKDKNHPQLGEKNSQFGTRCVYNEELRKTIHIKASDVESYLNNGWKLGAVYNWDSFFKKKELKVVNENKRNIREENKLIFRIKNKEKHDKFEEQLRKNKILYTEMYKEYCINGFDGVKEKYNYKYSISNFVQQCKRYVEEYIPQNGKKRGIINK